MMHGMYDTKDTQNEDAHYSSMHVSILLEPAFFPVTRWA